MRTVSCATCRSPIWDEGRCVRCADFGHSRFVELERWAFCNRCGSLRGNHAIKCPQEEAE